jgi:hypothetical protein
MFYLLQSTGFWETEAASGLLDTLGPSYQGNQGMGAITRTSRRTIDEDHTLQHDISTYGNVGVIHDISPTEALNIMIR